MSQVTDIGIVAWLVVALLLAVRYYDDEVRTPAQDRGGAGRDTGAIALLAVLFGMSWPVLAVPAVAEWWRDRRLRR